MNKLLFLMMALTINSKLIAQDWTTYNTANTSTTLCFKDVNAVAIDSQGNKWFGTQYGISKFNSTTWITFVKANSGLCCDTIFAIKIDGQGNYWFGTNKGLSKFNGTNWTTYHTLNSGIAGNIVKSIAFDAMSSVWIGTTNGLSKFDGSNWTTYRKATSGLVSDTIYSIFIDDLDKKWLGTHKGISKFDNMTWTTYNTSNSGLVNNRVTSIVGDNQANKWFGTYGGVSKLYGTTWTSFKTSNSNLVNDTINGFTIDSQNVKWFCTNNGISKFDGTSWTTYNTTNSGLSNKKVRSVSIDEQNNKWFATEYCVSKFDNTSWTVYSPNGLCDNRIKALSFDLQGNAWIGTEDGLSKFDGNTWTTYNTYNSGIQNNVITAINVDSQGLLWIGTYGNGIFSFDGTLWTNYPSPSWIVIGAAARKKITSIAIDGSDYKWIGTESGYTVLNADNVYYQLEIMYGYVSNVAIDPCDTIQWINYPPYEYVNNGGSDPYSVVNYLNTYTPTNTNGGFVNSTVKDIAFDPQNNIWFATMGGVSLRDGIYNDWTPYTSATSGLVNDTVYAVEIDLYNNKWFGTQNGISKFNTNNWTTFNTSNSGLCNNTVKSMAIDSQGNIWFSTLNGISKYGTQNTITITGQPQSTTICQNGSATFSVAATGAPTISYQWYHNSVLIPNATQVSFTVNNAQLADTGTYYCILTNSYGNIQSNSATLTIISLTINNQPISTDVCIGGTASFSVTASSSATLSYQWYHDGVLIPNATQSAYLINNVQTSDEGTYYCIILSSCGTLQSNNAILSIISITIYNQPIDVSACIGGTASFSITVSGSQNLFYQWYHNGSILPNGTQPTYTIFNVQSTDAGLYYCTITNSCGSSQSNNATLTVYNVTTPNILGATVVPEFSVQTYSVSQNSGSTYAFSVVNGNIINTVANSVTIQWGATGWGKVICIETNNLGCPSNPATLDVAIGSVGTNEHQGEDVSITPNPSSGLFNISCLKPMHKISVFSLNGKLLFEQNIDSMTLNLDLSTYGKGVYYLLCSFSEGVLTRKVLVR